MKNVCGWWIPEDDVEMSKHIEAGPYEELFMSTALERTKSFNIFVDVGSHVGLWTSRMRHHFDKVIAFEPNPRLIECFWKNIGPGWESKITLHNKAVGEANKRARLQERPKNTGISRVNDLIGNEIDVVRLDDVIDNVDFLKMDIEGYEDFALIGAEQIIKKCKPLIFMECVPGVAAKVYGTPEKAAINRLIGWGYKVANDWGSNILMEC